MNISEVKALTPKADVYELRSDTKYLVLLSHVYVAEQDGYELLSALAKEGINAFGMFVDAPESVRILELGNTTEGTGENVITTTQTT